MLKTLLRKLKRQTLIASLLIIAASGAQSQIERTVQDKDAIKGGNPKYWHTVSGYGTDGSMTWTYVNGNQRENWMLWNSGLPAGRYQVLVFIPRNHATTRNAVYHIMYRSGNSWSELATRSVDQNAYYDVWVDLGTFDFPSEPAVLLGDDTGESYRATRRKVGFDAVRFIHHTPVATDSSDFDGFDYPFGNRVDTSGWRNTNIFKNQCPKGWCGGNKGKFHPGEDWRRISGRTADETVYAIGNGVVKSIKRLFQNRGWGIAIRHDTWKGVRYSVYIHVYKPTVTEGQRVRRGQPIAKIYPMSGPHLHLEIRSFMKGDGKGDWYPNDDGVGYYYTLEALLGDGFLWPTQEIEAQRPRSR